jgi:hypothetical protein
MSAVLLATVSIAAHAAPALELTTTVGLADNFCVDPMDPDNCSQPPSESIQIAPGEEAVIAYSVLNIGDTVLGSHTLVDSELGTILSGFPFSLQPASTAYVTQRVAAPLTPGTYPRAATWTAGSGGPASDSDAYSIVVVTPELMLDVTIGLAADVCSDPQDAGTCSAPTTDTVLFQPGQALAIAYRVSNVGPTAFEMHDLVDDELGIILNDFPFTLMPANNVFVVQLETPAAPYQRSANWSGVTAGGYTATSSDIYAVQLPIVFQDGFE